jgi:cob(I)alamin adenosyltransferase
MPAHFEFRGLSVEPSGYVLPTFRSSMEEPVPDRRGTVQVYTGDGKGKTTAALGLALRAVGHGMTVYMLQFMKGSPNYGELSSAAKLPGFIIEQSGRDEFVDRQNPAQIDKDLAAAGLEKARAAVAGGRYDIVILDEANVALDFGLISLEDLLSLIEMRPPHVELILTGRSAHPEVVKAADLVSEVLNIRHHYDSGVQAREGIEF